MKRGFSPIKIVVPVGAHCNAPLRTTSFICTKPAVRILLFVLVLVMIAVLLLPTPIAAQGDATPVPTPRPVSDNEVNRVSKGLYCPVCQNVPLEVCETTACQRWREQVRDLLAQGYTEQQVREYFVERFGPQTVGVPTNPLAQLLTVGLPIALIVLLGGLAAYNVIQWRKGAVAANSEKSEMADESDDSINEDNHVDDDYRARLESELRKRE